MAPPVSWNINGRLSFELSYRMFERLGGRLDEIVTVSVLKYNVIISRHKMTSFNSTAWKPLPCAGLLYS